MVETAVVDRHVLANVARYAAGAAVLAGLYLTSHYSYNLFHGLAELFSVVVEAAVFVIAWNARRYFVNNYVLSLGSRCSSWPEWRCFTPSPSGAERLSRLHGQSAPRSSGSSPAGCRTLALIAAPLLMRIASARGGISSLSARSGGYC